MDISDPGFRPSAARGIVFNSVVVLWVLNSAIGALSSGGVVDWLMGEMGEVSLQMPLRKKRLEFTGFRWKSLSISKTYIKGYRPCRRPLSWAIWFKSWWCLTGPSTWTQNATQPSPDTPKTATSGDRLKTAKHHLNPDANPAKNPPPQRAEVTSLKPIKEKKQAPARGHKTQRNLAQTRPKQQPPGDRLKTAKHHLNPDANPAKNPPPQRAEVTSLKPIKEKKQAPARGHKTQRNLAQTRPKQQPPGDRLKTAKHHLNPDANPAKTLPRSVPKWQVWNP